jgi:hypothetical protein
MQTRPPALTPLPPTPNPPHQPTLSLKAKSDPAVFQHSCVAFTAGAAIITLLRWLVDIRCGGARGSGPLISRPIGQPCQGLRQG